MTDADWHDPGTGTLVMALSGELFTRDEDGHPLRDSAFLVVLHRGDSDVPLTLPPTPYGTSYRRLLDTAQDRPESEGSTSAPGAVVTIAARTVCLFRVE